MSPPGDARHRRPPPQSRRARRRRRRSQRLFTAWLATAAPPTRPAPVPDPVPAAAAVHTVPDVAAAPRPGPEPLDDGRPAAERRPEVAAGTLTLTQPPPAGDGAGAATAESAIGADDRPPGSGRHRSPLRNTVEWVLIIGAALVAAVVIKTYLIQAFYIPSPSMEPTLEIQDRVLVNKLSYRLHDVNRGDLVVFERPPNDVGQIKDLIKRVVALPGETVEAQDGTVRVDGRVLSEPYLPSGTVTGEFGPVRVPPEHVWVMGDNRGNSSDSRVFGAIAESSIIGRAFVRVWPVTALRLL